MQNEQRVEITPEVQPYLDRIGFQGRAVNDRETLFRLQLAHYTAVPYENFDILMGRPISLELGALYRKIVLRRRGGYCFELNGLFGWLLRQLGFPVTEFFARYLRDEPPMPMRRHRVLLAEAGGERYLCDVGVGGVVPRLPLLFREGVEQPMAGECYRLAREPLLGWVVQELRYGQWSGYISFTEDPQYPVDFAATSFYCEKSPDSIFNKEPMAAILTADGRVSLSGREFKIFAPGGVRAFTARNDDEFYRALMEHFGIDPRLG